MTVALDAVNIDCSDAEKLAGFWPAALRRQVRPGATAESATVEANDVASIGPLLMFHQVPEPKTLKNRPHLDLVTQKTKQETRWLLGFGCHRRARVPRERPPPVDDLR